MAGSHIKSRAEFFDVLDRTIADTAQRLQGSPDYPAYQSIAAQLAAIKSWTAGGRTPTPDERGTIRIGLIAARELQPEESPEEGDYVERLHMLNGYLRRWPDDPAGGVEA